MMTHLADDRRLHSELGEEGKDSYSSATGGPFDQWLAEKAGGEAGAEYICGHRRRSSSRTGPAA